MTAPTRSGAARASSSLAQSERRLRYAFAAELLHGRRALALSGLAGRPPGPTDGLADAEWMPTTAFVDEAVAQRDALVCLDGPGAADVESLLAALAGQAEGGAVLVIALPATAPAELAEAIPGAITVRQHVLEATWLMGPRPSDRELPRPDVDPRDARWVLLVSGLDDDAVMAACDRVEPAAGAVHHAHHAALESAYAELRRANARLLTDVTPAQSSAAASLQSRIADLQTRVRWLEERLALEIEVARRNDEYFQSARALLHTPRHRAVESVRQRVLAIPLVGRLVRLGWRIVSGGR